jgi:hypothetical protein
MAENKADCGKAFDAGWDGALDAFEKQWRSKPSNITRTELIQCTDRLLLLLRSDKDEAETIAKSYL